jgi:hypothetical protein
VRRLLVPILCTAAVMLGLGADQLRRPAARDVNAYHERVAAAVRALPTEFGKWRSREEDIPPQAIELLRPNALFGRTFFDDQGSGATVYVIQSRDVRDLRGHYPPVCYPAHGWQESVYGDPQTISVTDSQGTMQIPIRRYEFVRQNMNQQIKLVTYTFFVLPEQPLTWDMNAVYKAAGSPTVRHLGAAQVQVAMRMGTPVEAEPVLLAELLRPILPAVREILKQSHSADTTGPQAASHGPITMAPAQGAAP